MHNSCQAPTLQSRFETTINMKENNFNFGVTIYLKSRHGAKPDPVMHHKPLPLNLTIKKNLHN